MKIILNISWADIHYSHREIVAALKCQRSTNPNQTCTIKGKKFRCRRCFRNSEFRFVQGQGAQPTKSVSLLGLDRLDDLLRWLRRGVCERARVMVSDAVQGLDGVNAVDAVEDDADSTSVRLHTDARPGLLTELGNLARDKGWTVTELTRVHHDLEDIFKKLKTPSQELVT